MQARNTSYILKITVIALYNIRKFTSFFLKKIQSSQYQNYDNILSLQTDLKSLNYLYKIMKS